MAIDIRHALLAGLLAASPIPMAAQPSSDGGITPEMLLEIQGAQGATPASRALFNAVAANAIDDLAANHSLSGGLDTHFSVETRKQSITDQKQSGRCWLFSGLNVLRGDYALTGDSLSVELSEDYVFFWDQLEKANLFLQSVVDLADRPMDDERVRFFFRNPTNDGGTFCGVSDLVDKYGLVPREAMPETFSSENTSRAFGLIQSKLREQGLGLRSMVAAGCAEQEVKAEKTRMLSEIYGMLSLVLGTPPREFTYAFRDAEGRPVSPAKTYTPMAFAREILQGKALGGSFIMVMNDPRREYYKTYEVEYDRHTYDGTNWKYLNLPIGDIASLAIDCLRDGHKMYSSYDVGKFLDRKRGYCDLGNFDYESLFGVTFGMDKAERIATFDSGSTHAMALAAVDIDEGGNPTKWKVENSWGAEYGQAGCLIMTHEWFSEFMFRLVVDKKYVPAEMLRQYEQAPEIVMPEDPLFLPDE